ncbi:MAG: glycosyltransferase [Cyclobacteriaceae bacterium]
MNILIALPSIIPAHKYGGIERVVWCLGKELVKLGHKVTYLVNEGSYCDFASVIYLDKSKSVADQIPKSVDLVHFNYLNGEKIDIPSITTMHGNLSDDRVFDQNTVFVSRNHATRFGSTSFVYNGLDWNEYGKVDLKRNRNYFHFLGKAAWRVKNVVGAIDVIKKTKAERLKVLGGSRLNIKMGFRLTLSSRISFYGLVGGDVKHALLRYSKGLIFPVRWNEPFGLAITESLYFGCPVFGTPYGSLPELVPNELGHLSSNSNDLAEAVSNVDSYPRERCHEYARDVHNSRVMAEAYLVKYEKVLNGEKLNPTPPKLVTLQKEKFLPWS